MPNDVPIRRENNFPWCGRLIVMPTGRPLEKEQGPKTLENALSIDFPAMPDSILLQRNAEYAVTYNAAMPDGMHQYKGTAPLEIPFKFRLHAFDEHYCSEGPLSLLRIASRLHAMVLPLNPKDRQELLVQAYACAPINEIPGVPPNDSGQEQANAQLSTEGARIQPLKAFGYELFNPVTIRLEIMYVGEDQPGIGCTGYLKNVSAELMGPWLRGPDMAYNLPTAADFSFTFVHRPAHGNAFNIVTGGKYQSKQAQAYAEWVKDHLYNTRALTERSGWEGNSYQGFDSGQPGAGLAGPAQSPVERTELLSTQGQTLYQLSPYPIGSLPPLVPTNADANSLTNNPTAGRGTPGR